MKRLAIIYLSLLSVVAISAQDQPSKHEVNGKYKFQISVVNQRDSTGILDLNQHIDNLSRRSGNRGLGTAILNSLTSSVTQRTINASSNLVSLGVSLIVEQLQKNSKNFESWSKAKQQQCTYTKDLSSEEKIDDFYYLPSTEGALDPRNMKFNGFKCRNYIAVENSDSIGHDAFYISCSLRADSLGVAHMANHSKFILNVDTLIFYPQYCNIPNIDGRKASESYNFDKFSDLTFQMKVKVTSSWINEAVMVTSDQQLGEFTINATINKSSLNEDNVFVYDGHNAKTLKNVTICGDSFVVPRSFVGTSESPLWGTGQYKLDMEVSESCQLNSTYYKIEGVGNGEAVNFANLPGYKRWDKEVWQTEWKAMNKRQAGNSFAKNAWQAIKTAYIDDNWVKELVDPIATTIYQEETTQLQKLFKLTGSSTTSAATPTAATDTTQLPTAQQPAN